MSDQNGYSTAEGGFLTANADSSFDIQIRKSKVYQSFLMSFLGGGILGLVTSVLFF